MSEVLKQFQEKVENAPDTALVDSLIEHAQKMMDDMDYYEAVKVIKAELLKRLRNE